MKKIILSIASIIIGSVSYAQDSKSNTGFGIKGGVNFTNLYTDDVNDNNMLTSFNVGVFATLPLTSNLAIQPEVNFSRKGAELVYDNLFASGTAKFKLNYIEVPVLLKINITDNFNIHAGPYLAYLINAQVTNESSGGSFDFEENFDNDDFEKFDYGLSGGLGFDFTSISIGARYNYGLATIGKERTIAGNSYRFPDSKNSAISLYIALKF